jgi:hypothetical protein
MELIEGFLLMAAPDDVTGPINLGNLVETTVVGQLAEKIIALIGSRPVIERRPLPDGHPVQRCHRARTHHRLFRPPARRSPNFGAQAGASAAWRRGAAGANFLFEARTFRLDVRRRPESRPCASEFRRLVHERTRMHALPAGGRRWQLEVSHFLCKRDTGKAQ